MAEITMPRLNASPVARRLAARRGVALDGLTGSGPGGRVVKADIERAAQHDAVVEAPAAVAAGARGEVTVE
jgi:pyruvate dehydrogenase E2 component (dihydrolipoamide acetyltransferase)